MLSSCNFLLRNFFKLSILLTVAKSSLGLDLWIGVCFPQNVFGFFSFGKLGYLLLFWTYRFLYISQVIMNMQQWQDREMEYQVRGSINSDAIFIFVA